MNSVTGSKQFRSIVVQHRPGKNASIVAVLLVLLVVSCSLFFWLGGQSYREELTELTAELSELKQQFQELDKNYQSASQQLANQTLGAEVDRQAVEEIRAVVREHKQTITELNEEITFYKGLMAPTERERGLGIRSWEIYPTNDPDRYQFKLVMQQLALNHTVLTGSVSIILVGKQAGIEESYSIDQLSEQVQAKDVRLRFKYFQYIDGELQLPPGFTVDRVDIVARASRPKSVQVEKHYGWIVQTGSV